MEGNKLPVELLDIISRLEEIPEPAFSMPQTTRTGEGSRPT